MPDFGFVGPSYTTVSPYQDAQECINFYPEIDATKQPGQRGVIALYPSPGLNIVQQVTAGQEVRGMRALSGGQFLISAIGNKVYKTVVSGSSYTTTQIGTLTTSDGLVSMTDNQSPTYGLYAYMADGANRYVWFAATNTFEQLPTTDGAWTGADFVDVVDTYIIYNEPGTQNFGATDYNSPYSTAAYYGTKDGAPDNLVGLIVDHRQIYLIGEKTTEVWVDVGSQIEGIISFPFQRVSGTTMQHGTAAPWTMARLGESFAFLSRDERGTTIVGQVNGYQFQRLSNHAVEASLIGYQVTDAFSYTYQILGHEFYVITIPEANLTWVYDSATQMWHKWLEWSNDQYNRHRSNCMAFFNNDNFVGGYNDGTLYTIHADTYLNGTDQIRRLRRAPHLVADFQRQYFEELQIQFQPGVGVTDAYFEGELATETGLPLYSAQFYGYVYSGLENYIFTNVEPQITVGQYVTGNYIPTPYGANVVSYGSWDGDLLTESNDILSAEDDDLLALDTFSWYVELNQSVTTTTPLDYQYVNFFNSISDVEDPWTITTESGDPLEVDSYHTPGADPEAMLRWSDDGGSTWSNEHWKSIGKIGQYKNRCIWRRLGWARDRVFEVVITDPVKAVIISANLKGSGADN